MFPQRRMTTDTPDGNYSQALNLFVRGEDGWVQMPSRNISLNDYMKQLIKAHNADIDTEGTPEEFDMTLCEHLFDGPETIEGLLAEHYTLSWALASLRDKLKHYEDARIPEIMPEGLQTIERAIGTYGKDAQLTKAVEEMSELTKALCKLKECKRKYDTPFNRETQEVCSNIEEEIADVFIMLVQLFAIFNLRELVNITKIVWDKLDRLKDNLDKEAAKKEGRKQDSARSCASSRESTGAQRRTVWRRATRTGLASASARSAWPMRMAAASGWKERKPSEEKELPDDRRGEERT